jgi:YidC/Oxa1 family membrane protein insertase
MNNLRMILWLIFITVAWYCYTTYLEDQTAALEAGDIVTSTTLLVDDTEVLPSLNVSGQAEQIETLMASAISTGNEISLAVETNDFILKFGSSGDIVEAALKNFPIDKANPDNLVFLLQQQEQNRHVIQTGFRAIGYETEPNHQSAYELAKETKNPDGSYDLSFQHVTESFIAEKNYHIPVSGFIINFDLALTNLAEGSHRVMPYMQIRRAYNPPGRSYLDIDSYSYWGPAWYLGETFEKLQTEEIRESPNNFNDLNGVEKGWTASLQHHFVTAIVPSATSNYSAAMQGTDFLLTNTADVRDMGIQESINYPSTIFIGPKTQSQMELVSPELRFVVDYGKLSFIAQPLFWLLRWVHDLVGNWGLAIILVTLIIKTSFYRLTAKAGQSMAKMRNIQPRIKALQERYKDDKQALSSAMMDIYKKEKINPAAGCLPMLIQMPFFFAFYWVLIETVELRQAPFFWWISDLSIRDPLFVLPALNCIAMIVQTRLQPAPADPMQAKVMKIMPVAFSAMFAFFPAGLVLYWTTNALFSIAQQWRINKTLHGIK